MTRHRAGRALHYLLAAAYAYGAGVHLANMAGAMGLAWADAPLKWQVLDVGYLALNLVAAVGLAGHRRTGVVAAAAGAVTQILLYTLFRDWLLDVPQAAVAAGYLDGLVVFHVASLAVMALSVRLAPPPRPSIAPAS